MTRFPEPTHRIHHSTPNTPNTKQPLYKQALSLISTIILRNLRRLFTKMSSSSQADVDLLRSCVQPLKGDPSDFDSLLQLVKERNAEFVLLGEASHGTHEFYKVRAEITKRLSGLNNCMHGSESFF